MWLSVIVFALLFVKWSVKWEGIVGSSLLLLLLLSSAALCRFFFQKRHPNFWLFWYNIIVDCFHSGFALPSLWVRSASTPKIGDKENPKRDEIDLDITYPLLDEPKRAEWIFFCLIAFYFVSLKIILN